MPLTPPLTKPQVAAQPPKKDLEGPWARSVFKFIGKKVVVDYAIGAENFSIEGVMFQIHPQNLFCIVETADQHVFVRVPLRIVRANK